MIKKLSFNLVISSAFVVGFILVVMAIGVISKLISLIVPDFGPFGDLIISAVSSVLVAALIMTGVDFYVSRKDV